MRKKREYVRIKKKEKKKPAPKKNRRNANKFAAVKPELNLRIRREEIEDVAEYFNTLPQEAKVWMNKFMEEYVVDKLDRDDLSKNLHNTKELKKSCDARNNARNKDILSRDKANGLINYIEDMRGLEKDYEMELENEIFKFDDGSDHSEDDGNDPNRL